MAQNAMKAFAGIGLLVLFSVFAACLLGPPLTWFLQDVGQKVPEWRGIGEYTLDRVMTRMITGLVLLGLVSGYSELGTSSMARAGLAPGRRRIASFWRAFLLTAFLLGAMSGFLLWIGGRRLSGPVPFATVIATLLEGLVAAVSIGILEEFLFRGVILQSLMKSLRPVFAALVASLFYSILHFITTNGPILMDGFEPFAGFRAPATLRFSLLEHSADPWLQALGLYLAGMCFCYAYFRTGHLFLSVGMHSGWVFFMKVDDLLIQRANGALPRWWLGGSRMIDGVFWQIPVIIVLGVLAWSVHRGRNRVAAEDGPAQESDCPQP